jgi:hypothetical protein
MPVFDEESAGENPFAAARARTVVRAGFGAAMLVAAVGFAAFYRGGGGLLFGGGHTFDLTVAVAGYMAALLFLFGFYGLLSEWARGGRGEPGGSCERLLLELADALARQVVLVADLLERELVLVVEAEAPAEDARLHGRQRVEQAPDLFAPGLGPSCSYGVGTFSCSRKSMNLRPSSSLTGRSSENGVSAQ